MKKAIVIILSVLMIVFIVACNQVKPDTPTPSNPDVTNPSNPTEPAKKEYKDGIIGENKDWNKPSYEGGDRAVDGAIMEDALAPSAAAEKESGYFYGENGIQAHAGMLTAGEIKDIKNLANWKTLFESENGNGWNKYIEGRGLYSNNIVKVVITSNGSPVVNAKVALIDEQGNKTWSSVSTINGEAALFYKEIKNYTVKIDGINQTYAVDLNNPIVEVNLPTNNDLVKELDLMLMVDTTGSMGDELTFLKEELIDMVSRIAKSDEAFSIRVSVNFYRDEGDEYIVKYFDFRTDINECLEQIKEQNASGGGDYPEAVHKALDNVVNGHDWRDNAIKLCFFVLDAPPHTEAEVQSVNSTIEKALIKASEIGVRVIPVASSGVDDETTYILRSFAIMTGGTYIFLTNDSGIGYEHLEPTDTEFTVEPLNECMIRVVCEYCGLEYVPVYTYDPNQKIQQPNIPEPIIDDFVDEIGD